jgi:hypothetical protein
VLQAGRHPAQRRRPLRRVPACHNPRSGRPSRVASGECASTGPLPPTADGPPGTSRTTRTPRPAPNRHRPRRLTRPARRLIHEYRQVA